MRLQIFLEKFQFSISLSFPPSQGNILKELNLGYVEHLAGSPTPQRIGLLSQTYICYTYETHMKLKAQLKENHILLKFNPFYTKCILSD